MGSNKVPNSYCKLYYNVQLQHSVVVRVSPHNDETPQQLRIYVHSTPQFGFNLIQLPR